MIVLTYKIKSYSCVYNPDTDDVEQIIDHAYVRIENPTDEEIANAKEVAYNGEITVEDDGQTEPEAMTTTEERVTELENENALLMAQVQALSDQNDFQEELIVELANIVYA